MANQHSNNYQKRRLRSSYASVVVSITLVLLLLGILGVLLLNTKKVADHFKEKMLISVYLKDNSDAAKQKKLEKWLQLDESVKQVAFVSKEKELKRLEKELGDDFTVLNGVNPLLNKLEVAIKADFVTPEKMATLNAKLEKNAIVSYTHYDKPLLKVMTENIKKISFVLLILSGIFAFIAIMLINSSIRLAIYAKRFSIKTMQLVGATKSFIRKPFIYTNMFLGIVGAIIANGLIGLGLFYVSQRFPELNLLADIKMLLILAIIIILAAIIITVLSTTLATRKFLRLKTADLY